MTDKDDTNLRDLDFIPVEYAESAERYRINTVGRLYSNYIRKKKRAADALGISEDQIDSELEPLMRKVEEYLGSRNCEKEKKNLSRRKKGLEQGHHARE